VLLSILEADASEFCVPSKVLTYFCAARPVLLSVPTDNLIARIVIENSAGLVCSPYNNERLIQSAETLINNPQLRERCGQNGLSYARRHFNIQSIADEFESILGAHRSISNSEIGKLSA
jgi:colanic acid biosynthesis glycosyl transferase WcaI